MDAIVDTGAVMLTLPQEVVEELGLEVARTVVVTYADACSEQSRRKRKEERPVAGPIIIKIGKR